ncbi:RnfH family protein [Allofrancisella guangzhouensis]|uniref:UPF0125 protein SD28_04890 n=1 Tax=Allofrancisella guangzhouensis TaxID=594679 RepID=A0A0A8EA29_9GAMM|nr:RnfH family protein [Allofrancisella guangzhouensis]AJC49016.1 hypothetical protein SD28_04890 [Allofrancisella guangzhouensis]MBK2027554.1 RnfH family protein [Allofrancisella guangzhouensis]MBK2044455.1 RnfH family protein [Allofrancisella guangzhouensis]MBK2046092.1 RnfH family protein [Allofrancisella guangzhouensis]
MRVEIIYPLPNKQKSFFIEFEGKHLTVRQAIEESKIMHEYPELNNFQNLRVGIYGQVVDLDNHINDRDRIEIYRDLTIDPKKARMLRAEQKRKKEGIRLFGA